MMARKMRNFSRQRLSPVDGMESTPVLAFIKGMMNRQPRVVSFHFHVRRIGL